MANGKTALVLSAGGMFGAYQAGAWKALSEFVKPDLVVGASIGSLNGWAVAGGCDAQQWLEMWLTLSPREKPRYRVPHSLAQGFMDPTLFEEWIQQTYSAYRPVIPYGLVMTRISGLRQCLVQSEEVTWQHLAASCAVPGLLPLRRFNGKLYADGGILTPLPLWAAARMGATRIVAVNVLQQGPASFRYFAAGLRAMAPAPPPWSREIPLVTIAPVGCLGRARDAFHWTRENAQKWAEAGCRDVREKEHVIRGMF